MTITVGRILLAALMSFAGVMHFARPKGFVRIVPQWVPDAKAAVALSGVAEIAGGVGLLISPVSRAAAWGLIALYIAVFPANVNMAVNNLSFGKKPTPKWVLWGRLVLQIPLIYWAWLYTKAPLN